MGKSKQNKDTVIKEQADKLADIILNKNPSKNKDFNKGYLMWLHDVDSKEISKSMQNYLLPYIKSNYTEEFNNVLELCETQNNNFSMRTLLSLMSSEKSDAVIRRMGLNYNPEFMTEGDIVKDGLETKLAEYMGERYGKILNDIDNAVDMADLLQVAFFKQLAGAADSHKVLRILREYLSSSKKGISQGKDPIIPNIPSLDSIIAFFNAYDDTTTIENVLTDIEKRVIFNKLSSATTKLADNPKQYRKTLNKNLDELLKDLKKQKQESEYEGSRRILNNLIEKYTDLRNFRLQDIRQELDGLVFPRFYQAEGVLEIYKNKRFLIADEMGTGKTAIAILASEYIAQQEKKDNFRTLVVTTNTNKNSFMEKINLYLDLPENDVGVINGGDRKQQYEDSKNCRYLIINYELLRAKDWKLEDYNSWEVDEDKYLELKSKAKEKYDRYKRHDRNKSERKFLLENLIRKNIDKKLLGKIESYKDINKIYDAYIRIKDLDEAKTVANNLKKHFNFDHVVIDEIQNAKNKNTLNSKAILDVTKDVEYVSCLSGTVFVNGLSDMGTLFNILEVYDDLLKNKEKKLKELEKDTEIDKKEKKILVKKYKDNLKALKKAIDIGDVETILLDNPRMIRDYLRPKMLRRKSKEVLDMPELNFIPILTDNSDFKNMLGLPMYQRMIYHILQSHDFYNSSDQLRALQMMLLSGGLYKEKFQASQGRFYKGRAPDLPEIFDKYLTDEESVKYNALEDLIKEITSNVTLKKRNIVVFSSLYRTNVTKYLEKRLKSICKCLRIDGEVKNTKTNPERDDIIKQFNEAEEPTVLIATLPTMKEAIELEARCSNVIFLDLPFTWSDYAQGYSRVYRALQDETVNIYNLLVSNSLDIGKLELILDKKRLGELLLEGLPLNKEELSTLKITETSKDVQGFLERFVKKRSDSSMKIMRDLYSAGSEKVKKSLGEKNQRSEVYADAYILNMMSAICTTKIYQDMFDIGLINANNNQSLDGKVLDLASGYGGLAHITNIKTENLEINPFMIERAKEYSPSANYTKGMMQEVNDIYGNNKFKAAILSLAFHYASDEEKPQLLYDLHKTLKKDGYLFLTESYKKPDAKNGSIDDNGIERLTDVLEHTGYTVVKSDVMNCSDRNFVKIIAQKTGRSKLYDTPFSLRDQALGEDEDPDDVNMTYLKDLFAPYGEEKSQDMEGFEKEFGKRFTKNMQNDTQ